MMTRKSIDTFLLSAGADNVIKTQVVDEMLHH